MTETFTAGDLATYTPSNTPVRVQYGPYKGWLTGDEDVYLVTFLDGESQGRSSGVRVSNLERKPKYAKDDKVRVRPLSTPGTVAAGPFNHAIGEPHYVVRYPSGHNAWVMGSALELEPAPTANTFTLGNVTYDLDAVYLDVDNDRWAFSGTGYGGMPLMTLEGKDDPFYTDRSLDSVVSCYGPLRKA